MARRARASAQRNDGKRHNARADARGESARHCNGACTGACEMLHIALISSVVSTEAPVSAFYSFSVARGACAQTVLFLIADALPKHPKAGKDLHCGAYCGAAPCLPVDRPQQVQASSPSRPPGPAELQKWHVPASMHSAPARQGAARPRRSTSTAAFTSSCWRAWCASACGRASPPAWA